MCTRMLIVATMAAATLAGGDHMQGGQHHDGDDNDDHRDVKGPRPPPPSVHRLLLSTQPTSVDMTALSASLKTVARQSDTTGADIHPLFVCPIAACPDGICPSKDLLTAAGCIVNTNPKPEPPQRGVPLQGVASVMDFEVLTPNMEELQLAVNRISGAVESGELSSYGVVEFENIHGRDDSDMKSNDDNYDYNDLDDDLPQRTYLEVLSSPSAVSFSDLRSALMSAANKNDKIVTDVIVHFACPSSACTPSGCPSTPELRSLSGCVEGKRMQRAVASTQSDVSIVDYQLVLVPGAKLSDALRNIEAEIATATASGTGVLSGSKSRTILLPPNGDSDSNNDDDLKLIIVVICICALVTVCFVGGLIYCCCCKKSTKASPSNDSDIESQTPSEVAAAAKNDAINNEPPVIKGTNDPY